MRLTASKVDLALACTWPFREDFVPEYTDSEAARLGREAHEALAALSLSFQRNDAIKISDFDMSIHALTSTSLNGMRTWVERGFACVGNGARWADGRTASGYPERVPGAWLRGTVDLAWLAGDTLHVRDWKTGRPDNVTPAERNGQLMITAWALQRITGASRVTGGLWFVRYDPSATPAITWVCEDVAEYDAMDLDAVAHDLRTMVVGEPNPGPHCSRLYCPALGRCPATATALVDAQVTTDITPATLPRLVRMLPIVEGYAARVREAATKAAEAAGGALDLGDGWEWRVSPTTRRSVEPTAEALAMVPAEAVKATVQVTKLDKETIAALDAKGLVKTSTTYNGKAIQK